MKKIVVDCENARHEFIDYQLVTTKDGVVNILRNNKVFAQFKNWNYWYEEHQEKEEN